MHSDGQLYSKDGENSIPPPVKSGPQQSEMRMPFSREELMILGIIYVVMSDKNRNTDIALIAALVYILLVK